MITRTIHIFLMLIFWSCTSINQKKLTELPDIFPEETKTGLQDNGTFVVSTSQIIDPAGETVTFPGRITDLSTNDDETIIAVKNMRDVVFFNINSRSIFQTLKLPGGGSSFNGICWKGNKVWITDNRGFLRIRCHESKWSVWMGRSNLPSRP